jgi:hypothetical protein
MKKTFIALKENCIFEHYSEVQARKNHSVDKIFVLKKNSDDLFRADSYRHLLVLHKDAHFY